MKMSRKAVFFDADGTVCDMKKGVPDSAIEAIRSLVDNGHEAWLCTGRSRAFVSWYLEQIPFTGMISACGSTIEKDGKILFNKEMTPEVAKLSVEVLRKYGLIPVMEGADFMYYDKEEYTDEVNWYASLITESLGDKWRPIRGNEGDLLILDEVLDAARLGFLPEDALRKLTGEAAPAAEVVVTGRGPAPWLLEAADYVTHMVKEKHPYDRGIAARRGVEY